MDKLVFVIRDYTECIIRHLDTQNNIKESILVPCINHYAELLQQYDKFEKPKIMIYYEDLITNPKDNIKKIFDFIDSYDINDLENFFENIEVHKTKSLLKYKCGQSKGKLNYHKNKRKSDFLKRFHKLMRDKSTELYDKYLTRYKEIL